MKDWLVSTVLLLVATLLMSVVGLQTLSRWLVARKGYAQRPATLGGIALGALTGGVVGFLVPVFRDCGVGSAPGWLGFAVAALGLLTLLLSLLGGRRR